jgi:hypothetical protein
VRRHQYGDRVRVFTWLNDLFLRGAGGTIMRASTYPDGRERLVVLLDVVQRDVGVVEVSASDVVRVVLLDVAEPTQPAQELRHRRLRAMATPLQWDSESGQWHVVEDAVRPEPALAGAVLRAFGRNLRRERRRQRLSQTELAARVSMDTSEISRVERGLREVGLLMIVLFARALDVNPDFLLVGAGFSQGDRGSRP